MIVIGICGASGSGKSTLAYELADAIGANCTVINHDCYYKDHSHLPFDQRCQLNYDEQEIFDHDLFLEDMKLLLTGKPITRKAYNYAEHRRDDKNYYSTCFHYFFSFPANENFMPNHIFFVSHIKARVASLHP